jgi:hypothetical protein
MPKGLEKHFCIGDAHGVLQRKALHKVGEGVNQMATAAEVHWRTFLW